MVSLIPLMVMTAFVVLFGCLLVWVSGLFGPKGKDSAVKKEVYECGVPGQYTGHSKIPVKFYLTAILFILFDIEIIFMYPWAISYVDFIDEGYGLYILSGMGLFIAIFAIGLFWEVKSKALEWE